MKLFGRNKNQTEKSINEFHAVARHWEHLKKTYKDGLDLGDYITMEQIERFIMQKCKVEGIEAESCVVSVTNPDNKNPKYRLELNVKVEGKIETFIGI